jgi:restriction system protein
LPEIPIPEHYFLAEHGGYLEVLRCPSCGWWHLTKGVRAGENVHTCGAFGQLKSLDISDISLPIDEVRSYLAARYDSRFTVDPIVFEKTVASVFRSIGYKTRVTNPWGDRGIDVYMDGANDSLIGVQVKRWKGAVNVEQVTALTGALLVNDCTRGVFVTTSRFRKGAVDVADRSSRRGLPIDLVDARKFYDILQIAQATKVVREDDPDMPWNQIDPRTDTGTRMDEW